MNQRSASYFCSLFLVLSFPATMAGQEDASFASFQFNRSLPGARSLAMGGAFVALADDATAAYSNPAGLTLIERPEISVEGRNWSTGSVYTNTGVARPAAPFGDFTFGETSDDVTGLSFVSYVFARQGSPWALALYRHEVVNYQSSFRSDGVIKNRDGELFGPYEFLTDLGIENYGASASWRVSDVLRLGLGISWFTFDLNSVQDIFSDPPNDDQLVTTATKRGGDENSALNIGLLWQIGTDWSLGAAYRQGPTFKFQETFPGVYDVASRLAVPDQAAVGLAFQPNDRLTLLLEWDWVEYSALLEGNRLGQPPEGRFLLDDANELRLGAEYLFLLSKGNSIALMAGAWHDPNHAIVFEGECDASSTCFRKAYFQDAGSDEMHYSGGVGVKLDRVEIDLGADLSDRIDTISLSTVVRF